MPDFKTLPLTKIGHSTVWIECYFCLIYFKTQEEIQDLKEQVQMLESASQLGVSSVAGQTQSVSAGSNNFVDQNDSMADLGIRKTLDYDTPQSTPTNSRSQ